MTALLPSFARFGSVRPLVRYVDKDQAVVEVMVDVAPPVPASRGRKRPQELRVLLEVDTDDGFHDEESAAIKPRATHGSVRMGIVEPRRWWPANMGEQPLYKLGVSLMVDDEVSDHWSGTVGLTSVRPPDSHASRADPVLLVNGEECKLAAIVPVDLIHERNLLPVAGDSLMIVRGHWGPDVLFEAADRAGILLIQCVPIDDDGRPEATMVEQINRLSRHPSLAGWYVGHLGAYTERMAYCISTLDPTRPVFRELPQASRGIAAA